MFSRFEFVQFFPALILLVVMEPSTPNAAEKSLPSQSPGTVSETSPLADGKIRTASPTGFTPLFNGTDLTGWCGREQMDPSVFRALPEAERADRQSKANADLKEHWRVADGEIINDGHGVFCTTEEEFGDFELLVDWKMTNSGTDSGIYLRGCPQVQIWDPNNADAHQYGAHLGSGGLWNNDPESPGKDPLVKADRPIGQWNTLRIRLVGDRATIHLNGQLVVDNAVMHNYWNRDENLYSRGPIQLQTHGEEMRFRSILIRRLDDSQTD